MPTSWCRWSSLRGRGRCIRTAAASLLFLLASAGVALAHVNHFGAIEIIHPLIAEPLEGANSTCAKFTIVNHGHSTEYLLGTLTAAATSAWILAATGDPQGPKLPVRIAIEPKTRLKLSHFSWCFLLSAIATGLTVDVDEVPGILMFENQGTVEIEFMVAPAGHKR